MGRAAGHGGGGRLRVGERPHPGRGGAAGRRRRDRRPDGVRRRVADRGLHHAGRPVRGGPPRDSRHVQLRSELRTGHPDRTGGTRGRVRLRVAGHHGDGHRGRRGERPADLRQQRAGDRGSGGQPGEGRGPGRLRQARHQGGAVCRAGAVRRGRGEAATSRRGHRAPGDAGEGRQGRAVQGAARRGGRRPGVPHRRAGGRRQGHRHRDPGGGRGGEQVPDRRACACEERRGGARLRRVRAVRGRPGGAAGRRLHPAMTRTAPTRQRSGLPAVLWLPAAMGLAFLVLRMVRALVTVPLVLPPVVGGVALLLALGRRGVLGRYLDAWFGVTLPFSTAAVVLAEAFVAMPFLVIAVEGALRGMDRRFEEAAATLGASRWTVFRRVTLPLVAPGIVAGAVLCWTRALGEFGATITFAGNFPGRTQTVPIAVYLALETDPAGAVTLSLVLIAVSVVVLVALRGRWVGGLAA